MKIAIIGPKGSGKTELFRALSGIGVQTQGKAVVKVKDPRLLILKDIFEPKKVSYPEIEYLDVAGGGKSGLGSKMLNQIRPYDCFVSVLDGFSGADPESQWKNIETDLVIADLSVVEKRLERLALDKKKSKDLVDDEEEELLLKAKEVLEKEIPLRRYIDVFLHPKLKGFEFLSLKPIVYVWNMDESRLKDVSLPRTFDREAHLSVSVKLERELSEIEDQELKEEFMKEFDIQSPAIDVIVETTYKVMNYITFFTAGPKEVKGWTITKGITAVKAAGVIHSDMERGFIRAEVISWDDFEKVKDLKVAKEQGLLRLEGKEYVVKDGDIITFRFKV